MTKTNKKKQRMQHVNDEMKHLQNTYIHLIIIIILVVVIIIITIIRIFINQLA